LSQLSAPGKIAKTTTNQSQAIKVPNAASLESDGSKTGDVVPQQLTTHEDEVKKPTPNVSVHDEHTAADSNLQGVSIALTEKAPV